MPPSPPTAIPHPRPRRPELLAPAGDEAMIHAAIENGADAIYFGLPILNARMRAENFRLEDLPAIVAHLHERGVRAYVTLNTLVFSSELEEFVDAIRACSRAGVDAVLLQDLGAAALAGRVAPDLPIHASTQMTLSAPESVAAVEAMGLRLERVVVPRELSLDQVGRFRAGIGPEVETFVHGALCVAYSGQCLTSEALGGRSANRGECAQACRLPYDLIADGEPMDVGDLRYVLSPKDLAAYEDVGELVARGVASLKIEGRLKSPEYVAATVRSYREAIDRACGSRTGEQGAARLEMDPATRRRLEMTFSRGFTGGYLHAIDHQAVVEGRYSNKRGMTLGRVTRVMHKRGRAAVEIALEGPLRAGDGVVFEAARPGDREEGGRVFQIFRNGAAVVECDPASEPAPAPPRAHGSKSKRGPSEKSARSTPPARPTIRVELTFADGWIETDRIAPGATVWKTSDPELEAELRASFEGDKLRFRRPVRAEVSGAPGEPLRLALIEMEDGGAADGARVEVVDVEPAQEARNRPLVRETLERQLGRMGDTPFELAEIETDLRGAVMVPVSRLNELRRRACEALLETRRRRGSGRRTASESARVLVEEFRTHVGQASMPVSSSRSDISETPEETGKDACPTPADTTLSVLCRTLEQVRAAASIPGVETIYTDFEDVRLHREAAWIVQSETRELKSSPASSPASSPTSRDRPRVVPATLQVVKPGEAGLVRKLLEIRPEAVLARNPAAWEILRGEAPDLEIRGDFSLNVANDLTARLLLRAGFSRLVPSFDLNVDQLVAMLRAAPADRLEIVIHQYMPMFHMEHCVFCRYMSTGTDYTNCGRPCESHRLALRDRMGCEHVVKADAGCRNTVFNGVAQSASEYVAALRAAGARRFRIDFLEEDADAVRAAVAAYLPVARGEASGHDLWRRLRAASKLGVTRGSLDHDR